MTNSLVQGLTIVGSIGVSIIACGFTIWGVGNSIRNDVDKKVRRNYQRLDELKDTHVTKEMCSVVNGHIKNTVDEIKSDVKKLLGKNGIK